MALYFGSYRQIQGDIAYNKKNYILALEHYQKGLEKLKGIKEKEDKLPVGFNYQLAYLLKEIAQTCATLIIQNQEKTKDIIDKYKTLGEKSLEEAGKVCDKVVPSKRIIELRKVIDEIKLSIFNFVSVYYWNQIIVRRKENNSKGKIKSKKITLKYIGDTLRLITEINKISEKVNEERQEQDKELKELQKTVNDDISDLYAGYADNLKLSKEKRLIACKKAIKSNQDAFSIAKKLKDEQACIDLQLGFLNLNETLFSLGKEQKTLRNIVSYIKKYKLEK